MIIRKKLYIMRGLPGSGKSYLARQLGQSGVVFSTDDFFMKDGKYLFDFEKLPMAHRWNQSRSIDAMKNGAHIIVIDNTNIFGWEARPYVEAGLLYGYDISIKIPETSWAFDVEELYLRNSHNLSKDVIKRMCSNFDKNLTVDDILKSVRPEQNNGD